MKFLSAKETAAIFKVNPRTLDAWVREGIFPKPLKVTARSQKIWDEADVRAFIQSRKEAS